MTSTDPWSSYRPLVEEAAAACADYLGRIGRSLAGEIAPDRHYAIDKAHALVGAALHLVDTMADVERWVTTCDAGFSWIDAGETILERCGLPRRHAGPHAAPGPCAAARSLTEARVARDEATEAVTRLAWVARDVEAGVLRVGDPDEAWVLDDAGRHLAEAAGSLGRSRELLDRARRLAQAADAAAATPEPAGVEPPSPTLGA